MRQWRETPSVKAKKEKMPALKFRYTKKSDIPADHAALYVEEDGVFVLDVDGAVAKEKLDEFRSTNSSILKALGITPGMPLKEILPKLEKLKEIDPDLFETLKKEHEAAEANKLTSKGKYEEALATQKTTMKAEFDKQIGEKDKEIVKLTSRLAIVLIDDAAATAGATKGIRATALADLKSRARTIFKLDGDTIKAFEGDKEKFGKDGAPLKIEDWIETLLTDAPHLFDANSGSGGGGGDKGGGSFNAANNPYSAATLNRTKQGQIERDNPTLAKQLQASAKT